MADARLEFDFARLTDRSVVDLLPGGLGSHSRVSTFSWPVAFRHASLPLWVGHESEPYIEVNVFEFLTGLLQLPVALRSASRGTKIEMEVPEWSPVGFTLLPDGLLQIEGETASAVVEVSEFVRAVHAFVYAACDWIVQHVEGIAKARERDPLVAAVFQAAAGLSA